MFMQANNKASLCVPCTAPDDFEKIIAEAKEAKARSEAFHEKSLKIEALIKAFGSQGMGCGHIHESSSNVHHIQKNNNQNDEESQDIPTLPTLEIEEAEDFPIKAGKVGEIITSLGGALAIGPVLDLFLQLIAPKASDSAWFKPNDDLEISPSMFIIALALVIPAIYGAPHCHAQLEIASRTRSNFLILAKYAQRLLKWGCDNNLDINDEKLKMPMIKVNGQEIAIDEFTLIEPTESTSLTFKQQIQIMGDVEQHFNEYLGLTIIAIMRNIENPIAQLVLTLVSILIAAKACQPEVTTCANTLIFMNTLQNKQIINNLEASNEANWETKFSAIAKTPAVFYASLLSFQQICFGNLYAGLVMAMLATKGNVITQYFINANTQTVGESQQKKVDSATENSQVAVLEDERPTWQKLTSLGKELVVSRAFGTGNERSEPITISIIALTALAGAALSPTEQAVIALCLCLAGTVTAYSEARNAADHTARLAFFNKPLPAVKPENKRNVTGINEQLLGRQQANSSLV